MCDEVSLPDCRLYHSLPHCDSFTCLDQPPSYCLQLRVTAGDWAIQTQWIKGAWCCLDITNNWISMCVSSLLHRHSQPPLSSFCLLHLLFLPPFLPHSPSSCPLASIFLACLSPFPSQFPCCPHTSPLSLPPSLPWAITDKYEAILSSARLPRK